jgi:hypothetical protein
VKLYIDTKFARVDVDRFIGVYFSEAFNDAVAPVTNMKVRKLVEQTKDADGTLHRRVRMEPSVTLPGPIQKLADSLAGGKAVITYDEVTTYDPKTKTARFFIDSKLKERAKVEGAIRFVPDGDGVRRIIDGVVDVKAPIGLGTIIERFIESETQKGYAKIATFLQRYLDETPS